MPFLSGSLKKWKHRLSSHDEGKPARPDTATRGVSAPPEIDGVQVKPHTKRPTIPILVGGSLLRSPDKLEERGEVEHDEVVKMPDPAPALPVVKMPTPQAAETNSDSTSSQTPANSSEEYQDAISPPLSSPSPPLDPVQSLVVSGVAARVRAGPAQVGKGEAVLNKLGDKLEPVQVLSSSIDIGPAIHAIESGLKSFMEDIPWLMKSLDEVARVHPVVTVVVLAFKAVYTMEMTRRENDQRVRSLYSEMKDMIAILVQLRDVKDPKELGPDGTPIDSRLQGISEQAASDIKECANACDTYAKKRLVVKVLKGPVWEAKLVGFVAIFTKRRAQFEEALAIHTARVVDNIQSTVYVMNAKLDSIEQKIALFNEMFQKFMTADEKKIAEKVKGKGDIKTIQRDDSLLRDLNDLENSLDVQPNDRSSKRSAFTAWDLREELQEDFDLAIVKNMEAFQGKFVLYQKQLKEDLSRFIAEQNDRLLKKVKEGPHDRIRHPALREIWREMAWKRNVKVKLFVLTLRDHFREQRQDVKSPALPNDDDNQGSDDWAFEFLGLNYLQPVIDAFDEDGSGYVTVTEINRLTESLPPELNWSLQHWIAYWGVGWEVTTMWYAKSIHDIFAAMWEILPNLLPRNRYWADYYLDRVWPFVAELTLGIREQDLPDVMHKFQPYMAHEEERILNNLKDIRYDIDALDTVHAVAGPGRIETNVLPLIWILLRRDLQIFRVASHFVLNPDELWDSADSLIWIQRAIEFRVEDLTSRFQQQQLDVTEQFDTTAFGMFKFIHNGAPLWSLSDLQKNALGNMQVYTMRVDWYSVVLTFEPEPMPGEEPAEDTEPEENDYMPVPSSLTTLSEAKKLKRLLNYPLSTAPVYDFASYEEPPYERTKVDREAPELLQPLLGQWCGYCYLDSEFPSSTMWQFDIHAVEIPPEAPDAPSSIQADWVLAGSALDGPRNDSHPLLSPNNNDSVGEQRHEDNRLDNVSPHPVNPTAEGGSPGESHHAVEPSYHQSPGFSISSLPPLPPSRSDSSLASWAPSPSLLPPIPPTMFNRPSPWEGRPSPPFEAKGRDFEGKLFVISGRCYQEADNDTILVTFTMSYPSTGFGDEYWEGQIDESGSLVGYMGMYPYPATYSESKRFVFRRIPGEIMALRPSPGSLMDNKARSMWQFAIDAVLYNVRRRLWSWSFFKARRDHRHRYLSLNLAYWSFGRRPEGEEYMEFLRMRKAVLPQDANLIRSMRDRLLDTMPNHFDVKCAGCQEALGGQRIMCLDCRPVEARIRNTVNFCGHPICGAKTVTSDDLFYMDPKKPHLPTHDYVKLRSVLHLKDMPELDRNAGRALERCRMIVTSAMMNSSSRPASVETVIDGEVVRGDTPSMKISRPASPVQSHRSAFPAPAPSPPARSLKLATPVAEEPFSPTAVNGTITQAVSFGKADRSGPEKDGDLWGTTELGQHDIEREIIAPIPQTSDTPALDTQVTWWQGSEPYSPSIPPQILSDEFYRFQPKPPAIQCWTCRKAITLEPCWFCVTCLDDVFLCDDCEEAELFPCENCASPYKRPFFDWFKGDRPDDTFFCNICLVRGFNYRRHLSTHLFTHPLVRCKARVEDPEDLELPTTDQRLAALEEQVSAIDSKLDRLQETLENMFARMEHTFLTSLGQLQVTPAVGDTSRS